MRPRAIEPVRFGKYVLYGHLATGGMGEVFLAAEEIAGRVCRPVCIKTMRESFAADRRMVALFLDEARLTLQCSHPNLPHAFELGYAGATPYLALEYLEGVSALDLMIAGVQAGRALPLPAVLRIALGVADALDYLHRLRDRRGAPLGIVHRDVSPANIMITADGGVRLIDLGIARNARQSAAAALAGFRGKYSYQAPEQVLHPGRIDGRADLFALGTVLHELLCGRPLFRGHDRASTLERVLSAPIPDPIAARPDLPPALAAVLLRALARDPADRYACASDLLADLESAAARLGLFPSPRALAGALVDICGEPAPIAPPASAVTEVGDDRVDEYVIEVVTAAGAPDPEFDALLSWLDAA